MISLTPARRRLLIVLAVLSLAGYLGVAIHLGADHLAMGLGALGASGIAAVLGLSAINYALRFWRWHGYIKDLGDTVPVNLHGLYYLSGFAFTVSPGKAGEAVRALYLRRHKVPFPHALAALFVERVLDVLAISLLAVLCAGAFSGYRWPALALGLLIFAAAWLLGRPGLQTWLHQRAELASPRLKAALLGSASTLRGSKVLLQPSKLYPALLLGVVAWGVEGYGLWLLAEAMQVHLSIEAAVAIYTLGVLGGALSFFMPGGLGGMEAVMTGLLVKVGGATLAIAGAITLLCRFATLWFAVLLGLLALVVLELLPSKPHAPLLPKEHIP